MVYSLHILPDLAMSSFHNYWTCLLFIVFLLFSRPSFVISADLSPYLDSQTIGVIRINLTQLNITEILDYYKNEFDRALKEMVPEKDQQLIPTLKQATVHFMDSSIAQAENIRLEAVEKGKAEEIFLIIYKDAILEQKFPVLLAVPVPSGASQEQIDAIRMQYLQNGIPVTFVRHGFIVGIPVLGTQQNFASQQDVMSFARAKFDSPSTEERPEFSVAFAAHSDVLFQFVIGQLDGFQRELEGFLDTNVKPMLPFMEKEQRDSYNQARKMIPIVFQGLHYYSITYDYNKPEFRAMIQCHDEKTAKIFMEHESNRSNRNDDVMANLAKLGIPDETQQAIQNFVQSVHLKQENNAVITVIDASGMDQLKTLIYELIVKSVVQGALSGVQIGTEIRTQQQMPQQMQQQLQQMSPEMRQEFERQMRQQMQQQRRR